jgi:hypothetical protein
MTPTMRAYFPLPLAARPSRPIAFQQNCDLPLENECAKKEGTFACLIALVGPGAGNSAT